MFPKIDMASEKAMIEKWTPEEISDGSRGLEGSQEIEIYEETAKPSSEVRGERVAHTVGECLVVYRATVTQRTT